MYNIVNIPLVNTAIKSMKIFGFKISTINEANGFKELLLLAHQCQLISFNDFQVHKNHPQKRLIEYWSKS